MKHFTSILLLCIPLMAIENIWQINQHQNVNQCRVISDSSFIVVNGNASIIYDIYGDTLKKCDWGGRYISEKCDGYYLVSGSKTVLVDDVFDTIWTDARVSYANVMTNPEAMFIWQEKGDKIYKMNSDGIIIDSMMCNTMPLGFCRKDTGAFVLYGKTTDDSGKTVFALTEISNSLDTVAQIYLNLRPMYESTMLPYENGYFIYGRSVGDTAEFYYINKDYEVINASYYKHIKRVATGSGFFWSINAARYKDKGFVACFGFLDAWCDLCLFQANNLIVLDSTGNIIYDEIIQNSNMNVKVLYLNRENSFTLCYNEIVSRVDFDFTEIEAPRQVVPEADNLSGDVQIFSLSGIYLGGLEDGGNAEILSLIRSRGMKNGIYFVRDGNGEVFKVVVR